MKLPAVGERLAGDGGEPVGNSPREFAAIIRSDVAKWAQVIKAADITPE
jgi:tripartite-type tricarboxylate transporter receptor subunit TctC